MNRQAIVSLLICAVLVLSGVLSLDSRSKPDPARLAQAEQLYAAAMEQAGKDDAAATARFRESAAILEAELAHADSAGLHFNRANALLQAGDLGAAIASYRAAQLRSPADARIAANLGEARAKVARALGAPAPSGLEQACGLWAAIGEQARFVVAIALGFAGLLALGLRARATGVVCVVLGTLVAATVAADIVRRANANLAVIVESSMLRKGNGDAFEQVVAEALPAGTECRTHETRPGWVEIELGGGTRGWIRETAVARVQ